MLGADEEPNSPEGGGVSSSSSTPSHFSPPPHDMIIDQNLLQNGAFDLSCPESFTQIMEQQEQGQKLVNSDACSTNCTVNIERKRHRTPTDEKEEEEINNDIVEAVSETNVDPRRYYALFGLNTSTDDEEDEGINNAIVEAVSEIRRTNPDPYSPRRYYALFGLNTFTDDEAEEGHQQNERGEEFGNQDSEQQESEKKENLESEPNEGKEDRNQENKNDKEEETEKQEETEEKEEEEETEKDEEEEEKEELQEEEHTENAGDREHNTNHQNSEQQESGDHNDNQDTEQQENENQESEQDNEGENEENQEENDNEEEEEAEVDEEEEKRKADEKGKRPMSEICQLKFIPPKFFKFEKGGPSDTPEGDQTQENDHDQLNNEDEDLQVLAILKSIWHFKCNNGYFPYPTSDELHNHIMDSVPNLKILGEDLTNKMIALEDNFNTVRALDGDNPDTDRPIHREIFNWSMRLWGNSEDQNGSVEQQNQELYDVNIEQNSTANDLEGWSWW